MFVKDPFSRNGVLVFYDYFRIWTLCPLVRTVLLLVYIHVIVRLYLSLVLLLSIRHDRPPNKTSIMENSQIKYTAEEVLQCLQDLSSDESGEEMEKMIK